MGIVIIKDRAMTLWESAFGLLAWTVLGVWIGWLFWFGSRGIEAKLHTLMELPLNTTLSWVDPALVFANGWYHQEDTHRWTAGHRATLVFKLGNKPDSPLSFSIMLDVVYAIDRQPVTMYINGHMVGNFTFSPLPRIAEVALPEGVLVWNGINRFTINLPKARAPGDHDLRLLGIALKSFTLCSGSLCNLTSRQLRSTSQS
jgi:hypothetical protein